MPLKIVRGKIPGAIRALISGTPGDGKSTLASQCPGAVIIDTEGSTNEIDCARVVAPDWRTIEDATKELIADPRGARTIVYDTIDWLERALIEHLLEQSGKKSIEDFQFGRGYTLVYERMGRFIALVDRLVDQGVNVVFVAHTKIVRVSPPDQTDGYDRYELRLTKQVAPLVKEWSDLYLFCTHKVQVVEGGDGKVKAIGGKDRVMYTSRTAAWDAKNRFGLPDELPMEYRHIAHIFERAPRPVPYPASADQISRLTDFRTTPVGTELIEAALAKSRAVGVDELTSDQAADLLAAIEAALPGTVPAPALPANIAAWLDANAAPVAAYLVRLGWLQSGQAWHDLSTDRLRTIADRVDNFARNAGIPALNQEAA